MNCSLFHGFKELALDLQSYAWWHSPDDSNLIFIGDNL